MKSILRNNGLSIVLIAFFLLFWAGQTFFGFHEYNDDRLERGSRPIGWVSYIRSPHFLEATMENWESEFLQMSAYVFLTVFLFQKGSSESKDPDELSPQDEDPQTQQRKPDAPWPVRRGGWVLALYKNSLGLAFALLFLVSFLLHAQGGAGVYSEEQIALGKPGVTLSGYLLRSRFWFESLQNWQSEFLAMASMVVLSIFLRQQGSPESKPVAASHTETGDED